MSFDWDAAWRGDVDDVRPFFGETPEPVGAALAPLIRGTHERRGTVEELRQMRIEDGQCPRGSCRSDLEQPGTDEAFCPRCGWSLTEERMQERIRSKEDKPDYLPTLPGALQLDEYAAANIDEDAA